ncbi:MAG: hypothetical protein ABI778_08860, partial [Ignavibacteriota bacterium]
MYFLSRSDQQQEISSFKEEILRRAAVGDTTSYLYIVPTSAAARKLIDAITIASAGRAIELPAIVSLDEFIGRLARAIRPSTRVLSPAESAVFIELALKDLLRQNALHYFEGDPNPGPKLPIQRGTFQRIVASIASLKESGISPEKLIEDISRAQSDPERLIADNSSLRRSGDLAAIYRSYQVRLGSEFTDRTGQYGIVTSYFELPSSVITELQLLKINRIFRQIFPKVTDIFIGSFIKIPVPAREILFALSRLEEVNLVFELDYSPKNDSLFALVRKFIAQATQDGFSLYSGNDQDSTAHNSSKFLRENLFHPSG